MDFSTTTSARKRPGSSTPRSTCIARVGLAKTTLDDVAREAGCARATVYRCFAEQAAAARRARRPRGRHVCATRSSPRPRRPRRSPTRSRPSITTAVDALARPPRARVHRRARARAARCRTSRSSARTRCCAPRPRSSRPRSPASSTTTDAARLGEWIARITLSYLFSPSENFDIGDAAARTCARRRLRPPRFRQLRRGVPMTTNNELIGRDEINDLEAILSVSNTDVDAVDPHGRRQLRRRLHVGLRAQPPAARQALREGEDVAVERHDRPRLVDRRRPGDGRADELTCRPDQRFFGDAVDLERHAVREVEREGVGRARHRVAELDCSRSSCTASRARCSAPPASSRPCRGSTPSTTRRRR